MSHFFKELDRSGRASVDSDGSVWMELWENGEPLQVGLSANNALASGSNPQLAFKFLLTRTAGVLKSPKHRRETMQDFKQDWSSLRRASSEINITSLSNPQPVNDTHVALKVGEGKD